MIGGLLQGTALGRGSGSLRASDPPVFLSGVKLWVLFLLWRHESAIRNGKSYAAPKTSPNKVFSSVGEVGGH